MIDTHLHWFDPTRHAFAADAPYRPLPNECATLPALCDLLAAHGVQRGVLVAPTAGYLWDMAPLRDALQRRPDLFAGVARLRGDEADIELDVLAGAGVVGVRIDLRHDGLVQIGRLADAGAPARWAARGWFVQIQADAADWARIAEVVAAWPLRLVVDHCGLPDLAAKAGLSQPGFAAVCRLAARGGVWVKLSGGFRFSRQPWPFADTDVYAQALLDHFGAQRCVWGSDWPFVRSAQRLDYAGVLALLARWVPDAAARATILGDSANALLRCAPR